MDKRKRLIDRQTPEREELIYFLRDIILSSVIGFEEKRDMYQPVFHYLGEGCCYIGADNKGVYVGFLKGAFMVTQEAFAPTNQKYMRKIYFKSIAGVDIPLLESLIYEAVEINKQRKKK